VIPVAWGAVDAARPALYPVDVQVEASDRQRLLRDVSEVFAKEKTNVTGGQVELGEGRRRRHRLHDLHVEVADAARLGATLAQVCRCPAFAPRGAARRGARHHFTGIGVARSTATTATLFCGEPSITRSE
jgi:hypothetical protein